MAEIRTVTTLRSKRDEIAGNIAKYERLREQARADLAHIEAAISILRPAETQGLPGLYRRAPPVQARRANQTVPHGAPRWPTDDPPTVLYSSSQRVRVVALRKLGLRLKNRVRPSDLGLKWQHRKAWRRLTQLHAG